MLMKYLPLKHSCLSGVRLFVERLLVERHDVERQKVEKYLVEFWFNRFIHLICTVLPPTPLLLMVIM